MKHIYIACVLLMSLKIEVLSWAALCVVVTLGVWNFFIRCVNERERRYE